METVQSGFCVPCPVGVGPPRLTNTKESNGLRDWQLDQPDDAYWVLQTSYVHWEEKEVALTARWYLILVEIICIITDCEI